MILDERPGSWEAEFVSSWKRKIHDAVYAGIFQAVVLGASGGLDSVVCTALSVTAGVRVLALQMIDRRLRGEHYNTELYKDLGAELKFIDITNEIIEREKPLHLPPSWVTVGGIYALVRMAPKSMLWDLTARLKGSRNGMWLHRHYERLLIAHGVRRAILETFAADLGAAIVNCVNRTERELGYFVEEGIDDIRFGHWAPLADLYKFQVRRLARFLNLPDFLLEQSPSPGFGGVRDEDFLGPYELVDRVLIGLNNGWTNEAVLRALTHEVRRMGRASLRRFRPFLRKAYVEHLRRLRTLSRDKAAKPEGRGFHDRALTEIPLG